MLDCSRRFLNPRSLDQALTLGCLAAVVGLAMLASVLLVRSVSQGITSIMNPMRALSSGDLTAVISNGSQRTEIGQIAATLQVFKDALIAKDAADKEAAAAAEAKIERGHRVDAITRDFETIIANMVTTCSHRHQQSLRPQPTRSRRRPKPHSNFLAQLSRHRAVFPVMCAKRPKVPA